MISQWSCSASGSLWEMPDSNPGPLPQKSGVLPMCYHISNIHSRSVNQQLDVLDELELDSCRNEAASQHCLKHYFVPKTYQHIFIYFEPMFWSVDPETYGECHFHNCWTCILDPKFSITILKKITKLKFVSSPWRLRNTDIRSRR